MRLVTGIVLVVLAAGCGGTSHHAATVQVLWDSSQARITHNCRLAASAPGQLTISDQGGTLVAAADPTFSDLGEGRCAATYRVSLPKKSYYEVAVAGAVGSRTVSYKTMSASGWLVDLTA